MKKWSFTAACLLPTLMGAAPGEAQEEPAAQPAAQEELRPEEPIAIFEEKSVLTSKGSFIFDPSLTYTHSSSSRVAIEGFTIIPAVAIGLINVSELQRDTLTGAVALRYGIANRVEVEAKIPYVYRHESVREREFATGTAMDIIRDSEGHGLGDLDFALRYQFRRTGSPILIGNLRAKSRTGKDPFEVEREDLMDQQGTRIGEVFREQPTGSGFWGIQPGLTLIFPSDPAVLFFNLSYMWNLERDVGGTIGRVDPGDAIGISFGLGFSVNDRTSFSLGYDHNIVFKSEIENDLGLEPVFDRIQVGTLLLGASHRLTPRVGFNLSLGIGVTPEAPDLQLTLRFPFNLGG